MRKGHSRTIAGTLLLYFQQHTVTTKELPCVPWSFSVFGQILAKANHLNHVFEPQRRTKRPKNCKCFVERLIPTFNTVNHHFIKYLNSFILVFAQIIPKEWIDLWGIFFLKRLSSWQIMDHCSRDCFIANYRIAMYQPISSSKGAQLKKVNCTIKLTSQPPFDFLLLLSE